jgi:hypothetical protein
MLRTNVITLEGKIEDIGPLHFLRAEWQQDKISRFVLIRYALDGQEQPLGLRLDLDKKALLDSVGDPELDKSVQATAATIWSIIANEPFPNFFEASLDPAARFSQLGLLADLTGTWVGAGFNVVSLPRKQQNNPFFLQVSATWELLQCTPIGGMIPMRGSRQNDIALHGLTYRQQVADAFTGQGLHFEPGLWLNVPSTTDPVQPATVVRQAARIQHGGVLLAQGYASSAGGGPVIAAVDSTPFTGEIPDLNAAPATPITDPEYLASYTNIPLPAEGLPHGLSAAQTIKNPALVLQASLVGQNITQTNLIVISTFPAGGIINIPFAVRNANATRLDAMYWIERVRGSNGEESFQLQYVQRVILDFIGIHWPHISVGTLVKQ